MRKILFQRKTLFVVVLLTIFVTLSLLLSILKFNKTRPVKVRAGEVHFSVREKEVAQLLNVALAQKGGGKYILGAEDPLEVEKESGKIKTDFKFNALAPSWKANEPDGENVEVQIRTSNDGKSWSDWKSVEADEDGNAKDNLNQNKVFGNIIVTQASYIQQKIIFKIRDTKKIPEIEDFQVIYVDSKEKKGVIDQISERILSLQNKAFAAAIPSDPTEQPDVCSRACWGADESIYVPGEAYSPIQKMIVHHTVTSNSDNDPKATIRAIYYFHTIDRGWGDIGYNFLVDQNNGTIYEGRFGGDNVIGAHARGYNTGSVGVSVLGDFRYVSPNKKVQNALHKLAVWKLYSHRINPDQVSAFGDPLKEMPAITFHGDVGATACAGTYLNNFLPTLREMADYMPQQILLRTSGGVQRLVGSSDQTVADLLNSYRSQGKVDPNYINTVDVFPSDGTTPPNDTYYALQWDLGKLDALNTWKASTGGVSTVKIAVIDTGVAYENYDPPGVENYMKAPDLVNTNFVSGYDFVNEDTHPNDDNGHGTSVTSVIAGSTNNSLGVASLAYNTSIMPLKVCNNLASCSQYNVVRAIDFARINGAKVINMSLGSYNYSSIEQAAIDAAWNAGIVVVASAGNDNLPYIKYPAKLNHVIGVSATASSDTKSSFSNYGEGVDVSAPGTSVVYQTLSCTGLDCTNFSYSYLSGTSFSAPLVSASAALAISKGTVWSDSVERFLKLTSNDLGSPGWDNIFGWGVIRPFNTLSISDNTKPYPNGSLVRDITDNKIYIIEGGQKRWIPGPDILLSRYNPNYVANVPRIIIDSYNEGTQVSFNDGVLLRGGGGQIYILENGLKRWIRNSDAFFGLGYKVENVINLNDGFLSTISNGSDIHSASSIPNGSIVRAKNDQKVYLIQAGQKKWIPGPAILLSKFNPKYIMDLEPILVNSLTTGDNVLYGDGSLLRDLVSGSIYFISSGQKLWINHPMTFSDLGLNPVNIFNASSLELQSYPTGTGLK